VRVETPVVSHRDDRQGDASGRPRDPPNELRAAADELVVDQEHGFVLEDLERQPAVGDAKTAMDLGIGAG
jgi:hypothetical protein